MKKFTVVVLLAVGGLALASSLNVPWFFDNAAPAAAPTGTAMVGIVTLHNNSSEDVVCQIQYYAPDGCVLNYAENFDGTGTQHAEEWEVAGPEATTGARGFVWAPDYNTFVITPNASVSFRPVQYDPSGEVTIDLPVGAGSTAGTEGDAGVVVPNRPRYGRDSEGNLTVGPSPKATIKLNGSLVVTWSSDPPDPNLIQGRYISVGAVQESAYLLPGGS
jgi:hypothetical protein